MFRGRVKKKIMLCKGGGGGSQHEKSEYRGDVFYQLNLVSKKDPNAKMRKKCKKLSNIEKFFLTRFAHSAFYKIHISGATNGHAPVQYAKYVCVFFFFFFFSKQSS